MSQFKDSSDISLQKVWLILDSEPGCERYYCFTCGGKAHIARKHLDSITMNQISHDLKDLAAFELAEKDFNRDARGSCGYFPREKNVSKKVEFLLQSFNCLTNVYKKYLVDEWSFREMPDWLFDGISYYFIPGSPCKEAWLKSIRKRLSRALDSSLEETMRIKYGGIAGAELKIVMAGGVGLKM